MRLRDDRRSTQANVLRASGCEVAPRGFRRYVTDFLDGMLLGWCIGMTGFVVFLFVWTVVLGRPLMGF